jgi:hypothetical protein
MAAYVRPLEISAYRGTLGLWPHLWIFAVAQAQKILEFTPAWLVEIHQVQTADRFEQFSPNVLIPNTISSPEPQQLAPDSNLVLGGTGYFKILDRATGLQS